MKIDYEITVDVRGMSIEKKKQVQDAFFKLGHNWSGMNRGDYWGLEHDNHCVYTNKEDRGGVTSRVMYGIPMIKPTHTYNQLLELAGMTNKKQLSDLNSDQLRTKLAKNNGKINKLLLQNDEIVELLRSRALKPIKISQRYILEEPKPLTVDELMAGGWWMASATIDDKDCFVRNKLPVESIDWDDDRYASCSLYKNVVTGWRRENSENEPKQIHRIGNEFYWGEP